MSSLVHCIYVSTASHPFQNEELAKLLHTCRVKNERLGITGILLYMAGRFFQVLEGDPDTVSALYTIIERDKRHKEVTQIIFEAISKRNFPSWSMGMIDLSGDKLHQIASLSDPENGGSALARLPNGRSKKLLLAFCEGRWGPTDADLAGAAQA